MSNPTIAVADSVFPNLDLAKEALKRVDAGEFQMSEDGSASSILAVAADADQYQDRWDDFIHQGLGYLQTDRLGERSVVS